jgi:hypothetical protein
MRDYARQARKALEVYLNRGAEALEFARTGDVDRLNMLLGKRRAAFYNFRAADVLANKYSQVKQNSEEILALWKQIREIDAVLMGEMQEIKNGLAAQVAKFAENRKKMNRYKSGKSKSTQLETPV